MPGFAFRSIQSDNYSAAAVCSCNATLTADVWYERGSIQTGCPVQGVKRYYTTLNLSKRGVACLHLEVPTFPRGFGFLGDLVCPRG